MTTYDSAWCLKRFNSLTGRNSSADAISDTDKYLYLEEAQQSIVADIATICPWVLYQTVSYANMPTLTTTDNQVFTFGNDAYGNKLAPIGQAAIYQSLNDIPDNPWVAGWDYLDEGTQIRIPNNRTWTTTLFWRGVVQPGTLDAGTQPVLFPVPSRVLIPSRAAANFAREFGRNVALAESLIPGGDAIETPAFRRWALVWKTQFAGGGALGAWTGRQMAIAGTPDPASL